MDSNTVTLYTQDGCHDCERVRACFRRSGVAFVERNVTHDHAAANDMLATGVFATPLVQFGETVVFGARLPTLAYSLHFRCRCFDGSE